MLSAEAVAVIAIVTPIIIGAMIGIHKWNSRRIIASERKRVGEDNQNGQISGLHSSVQHLEKSISSITELRTRIEAVKNVMDNGSHDIEEAFRDIKSLQSEQMKHLFFIDQMPSQVANIIIEVRKILDSELADIRQRLNSHSAYIKQDSSDKLSALERRT